MRSAPLPPDESERLADLRGIDVLDTPPEQAYDDLAHLAAQICGTPIALVSLVDSDRQWFKARVGLEAAETARDVAFCAHAILDPERMLVVPDAHVDERFSDNPLVSGEPHVRFYAGAPLIGAGGRPLGTLCVIDREARTLTASQLQSLAALARQASALFVLRFRNQELAQALEDRNRAFSELEQFTSIAAHDLSGPARRMNALADMLREDLGTIEDAEVEQDLELLAENSARMQALIRALHGLSRANVGPVKDVVVPLGDCVRRAVAGLAEQFPACRIHLDSDALPNARVDPTLLTQVFENLLTNAVKFSEGEDRVVRITREDTPDGPIFGVRDFGVGFQAEDAEQIFAPFHRLHPDVRIPGSGIGLAIVRKVVERHGGDVWAESEPGVGSHFRFRLAPTRILDELADAG